MEVALRCSLAAVSIAALLAASVAFAAPGWPPAYDAAVRRYAAGERDGAVRDIASWPDSRLRDVRDLVNAVAAQLPSGPRCLGPDCAPVPLRAALMLHTDAAAQLRAAGSLPKVHDQLAFELARELAGSSSAFAERWFAAVAQQAQDEARFGDALEWAERGLRIFPRSADLLLVIGSVEETMAMLDTAGEENDGLADPATRRFLRQATMSRTRREHLQRAQAAIRAAAAAAPERAELSIRLGRIAWKLGDRAAARTALESALARDSGRAAYLGHLFLGRVEEDEGRVEDAVRSYDAAVSLEPECQTARLARSHARLLLGDLAAARADLSAALAPAGRRTQRDPFWAYPWGASAGAQVLMRALREEASR